MKVIQNQKFLKVALCVLGVCSCLSGCKTKDAEQPIEPTVEVSETTVEVDSNESNVSEIATPKEETLQTTLGVDGTNISIADGTFNLGTDTPVDVKAKFADFETASNPVSIQSEILSIALDKDNPLDEAECYNIILGTDEDSITESSKVTKITVLMRDNNPGSPVKVNGMDVTTTLGDLVTMFGEPDYSDVNELENYSWKVNSDVTFTAQFIGTRFDSVTWEIGHGDH